MRDIKSEIGKKLRRLREEKGMTREVLCNDESELTVRQLVRIEKGESLPSLKKLEYIANMLGQFNEVKGQPFVVSELVDAFTEILNK